MEKGLETSLNYFFDVLQGLSFAITLTYGAGKLKTLHGIVSVLFFSEDNREFAFHEFLVCVGFSRLPDDASFFHQQDEFVVRDTKN